MKKDQTTLHIYLADKGKLIQIQATKGIDTMPETVRHILCEYDKPQGAVEPQIKEIEKPLSANEFVVKISQEDLSDNIQSALKKIDNLHILRKHSISDFRQLAEKVMQDKEAINAAFT